MKKAAQIASLFFLTGCLVFAQGCKLLQSGKKEAQTVNPGNDFDAYFLDACTHFNNHNDLQALRLFKICADMKPEEASVHYQLSRLYERSGETGLSLQHASKASRLSSDNVWYGLRYAALLKKDGMFAEATATLEKLFRNHAEDAELAQALDELYARDPALIDKRAVLWEKHRAASGFKLKNALRMAEIYKQKKDYPAAHAVYEEINRASPGKAQFIVADALLYLEQKDTASAMLRFEKALEVQPNQSEVIWYLFTYNKDLGRKETALRFLLQGFSDPAGNVSEKLNICARLNRNYTADSGLAYYLRALAPELRRLYPANPEMLFTAARFFEQGRNYADALETYLEVCKTRTNMFDAWTGALLMSEKLSRHRERAEIAGQALNYYPNIASVYLAGAESSNAIGEFEKGLEFAQSGLSFVLDEKTRSGLLKEQALAAFGLGRYKEAETALLSALAINKTDAQLYDSLGNVYDKLGRQAEAVQAWQMAASLGLDTVLLKKKIKEGKYVE